MANPEHLAKLKEGVKAWNKWRIDNSNVKPDFSGANLSGANLKGANFKDANLSSANLSGANLKGTNCFNANLKGANCLNANLYYARLENCNLAGTNLEAANLVHTRLTGSNFKGVNLKRANLSGASLAGAKLININLFRAALGAAYLRNATLRKTDLSEAHLSHIILYGANLDSSCLNNSYLEGANLIDSNLTNVDFRNANLRRVQALNANFSGSTLTGACIENWNINNQTNLENVQCDYIYLRARKRDRRPHDPNKNFAPGEFAQLFQQALETVDLIFSEGIEWAAFLESFQQLQAEVKSEDLSIQAIEKKKGGAFIVRLEVPEEADKAKIEKYIKREYETKLKVIEAKYQKQLQTKYETIQSKNEELIKAYQQKGTDLLEMARIMSQNQRQNIINNNPTMTSGNTNKNVGIENMSGGTISGNAKIAGIINEAPPQDLTQAAAEIQQLLDQLQQTNGTTLETAQQQTAKDLATKANKDPQFKDKLINLSKFVGENSAKTLVGEGVKGVLKLLLLML